MASFKVQTSTGNLIAGLVLLVLGLFVWFNPFGTMLALAFYIGLGFVVAGVFYLIASMNRKSGWYFLVGIFDFVVGLILMTNLGVTAASLPIILALWFLTIGILQIIGAFDLKSYGFPWKWSLLMGIVGAVFGLIILSYPVVGAVTVSTLIGLYIVMFGILQLVEYYLTKDSYRIVIKEK